MKARLSVFWAWFCLAALLLTFFYAPVLFRDREFFVSDHCYFFEPFARFIASSYRQGHMPLWNPFCYCGNPQLANPSPGIFYVPNFLFIAFSYSKAMGLILMVHQLVAFVATFLLVESLGWGLMAAAFGGLLMAFNGYMMSLSANYTLPGTAAWGVLALYALLNVGRPVFARPAQKQGFVVLGILAVHFMLMAGRPEVFVPMMALLGAAVAFIWLGWISPFAGAISDDLLIMSFRERSKNFAWQISVIILGILLSMPMLLPVYEWSKLSTRAAGLTLEHVFNWSSNWYDLLCMLCPQPLGDLQQPSSKYLGMVTARLHHYPFLPSALIGPVAVSLLWLGLSDRRFKARFHMLGGLLVALLFAMGKNGGLSAVVLKAVPFLSVLRYPCKLLVVVIFFAAILGSRGLCQISENRVRLWQKKVLLGFWSILVAVAAFITLDNRFCAGKFNNFQPDLVYRLGLALLATSAIGLFVALLIFYRHKFKLAGAHLALILILLMVTSIFVPAMQNAPKTVAAGFFARPQALNDRLAKYITPETRAQRSRLLPLYFDPLRVADGYVPRFPNQLGETFMQYAREMLLPNTNIDIGVLETFGYESSDSQDFRSAFIKALHKCSLDVKAASDLEMARFCQITATRYMSSQAENEKGAVNIFNPARFKLLHQDIPMNVRLYEVVTTTPRAYFARSYRTIANQNEAVKAIFAPPNKDIAGNQSEFDQNVLVELDKKNDISNDWLDFKDNSQSRASAILNGVPAVGPTYSEEAVVSLPEVKANDKGVAQGAASASVKEDVKVEFLLDEPEHVSLSVKTPVDGFVILNDRFYPGWHAVVDTQPTAMYRANCFMRAVYVSKGAHLVQFNYEPESLRNGIYLALIAITIVLSLLTVYVSQPCAHLVTYLSTGRWPKNDTVG